MEKKEAISLGSSTLPAGGKRLVFLDGLRGLAALWVVLFHIMVGGHIEGIAQQWPKWLVELVFSAGHYGVVVFFVLSGYVMAVNVQAVMIDGRGAGLFFLRRLARLLPPYYAGVLLGFAVVFAKGLLGDGARAFDVAGIVAHLTLVQAFVGVPHVNIVFWTLVIEVQFYLMFILLVWLADRLRARFAWDGFRPLVIACACVFAFPWAAGWFMSSLWPGGFVGHWYLFLVGVVAAWIGHVRYGAEIFSVYILMLCGVVLLTGSVSVVLGVGVGVVLVLANRVGKMASWLSWGGFQWLGMVSYSLYLLHNPVIGVLGRVSRPLLEFGLTGQVVRLLCMVMASLLVAWGCYRLVERPSIRISHRFAWR